MATISLDYDSKGDVELILEDHSVSAEAPPAKKARYDVGPLNLNVKRYHLRVSSTKLSSSSLYFKSMLEGSGFREGTALKEKGSIQLQLLEPEDDATAMMIILGILYESDANLSVHVPTEVTFIMLEKISILVDKFQWNELVAPQAISWFDKLVRSNGGLQDTFDESLLVRLWIASLFGMKEYFRALSRVAQQDARNPIDLTNEHIRLSTAVLKAINKQRELAFQKVEQVFATIREEMDDPIKSYQKWAIPARRMLRCMVMGFIIQCSQDLDLGQFAVPNYAGNSVRSLLDGINSIESMQKFDVVPPGQVPKSTIKSGARWDVKYRLQEAIADLEIDEWGLNLNDFQLPPANRPKKAPVAE